MSKISHCINPFVAPPRFLIFINVKLEYHCHATLNKSTGQPHFPTALPIHLNNHVPPEGAFHIQEMCH